MQRYLFFITATHNINYCCLLLGSATYAYFFDYRELSVKLNYSIHNGKLCFLL